MNNWIKILGFTTIMTVLSFLWVVFEYLTMWANEFNYQSLYTLLTFFISLMSIIAREFYIAWVNRDN